MLLEVLSDFQISIPELGVIEARTHPVVVLTSNNSRELTEALKRRCLYLWLDYPDDRARDGDRPPARARARRERSPGAWSRSSTWCAQLDLKKPPSIAESIDWARALLLLGADDIDRDAVRAHDEHHRQAPHRHRPGGRAGRREAAARAPSSAPQRRRADGRRPCPSGPPARAGAAADRLLRGAARRGRRGRHRRRSSTRSRRSSTCPGPSRRTSARRSRRPSPSRRRTAASSSCSSTASSSAPPRPRRSTAGLGEERRYEGGGRARPRRAARGDPPGDRRGARRRDARPRAARDRRLRPPGRGLGRGRRRRAADPPHARPPARSRDGRSGRGPQLDREQINRFERHLRRELERALIERTEKLPPVAPAGRARPGAADEPHPGPRRGPPRRRPAEAPARDARARAARARAGRRRRHAPDDARLARDRRRAAAAALPPQAPAAPGDLRALRRLDLRHLGERVLPLGPARPPRLVPQAAQLRLHRADLRGHRRLRARARLPRDLAADQPRGRRRRRLRLHRLRPRLARVPARRSPTSSTRARR